MVDFMRQIQIFDPIEFQDRSVTIIGLGNIGSHAAICLARLGIKNFFLYDSDTIEEHNLSSQSYNKADIGRDKVEAVKAQILAIDETISVIACSRVYERNTVPEDIVVVGVDELTIRRELAGMLKDFANVIIDGRIGGEQLELYTCESSDEWAKTIPAGDGDSDPCGARYISYVSYIIGGLIACQVKKYLKGQRLDKSIMINIPSLQIAKGFDW